MKNVDKYIKFMYAIHMQYFKVNQAGGPEMLKDIVDDMMKRSEKESWETKTETWYRLNIMRLGYGFSRMIPQQSEDHPHGLSEAKAKAMISKGDTLHKITVTIERVK